MKVIVVGTSHAGYEAVQTILKEDASAEIHLYERGSTASFLSCGIQSYLEGIAPSLDSLHYANEQSYIDQGVNVHMNSDVVSINPDAKTINVKTAEGETEESYDKLFLSPGAMPIELPIEGLDCEHVYYMRGRDWADVLKERMKTTKKTIVIGSGYIGIEVAEAYAKAGIDTTVIDIQASILPTYLDKEFTEVLRANAEENGLTIKTGEGIQSVKAVDGKIAQVITDKATYDADTLIMAVGVRPNTAWLKGILDLDERGFVQIDSNMKASADDIYVAGDATKVPYAPSDNDYRSIALASNARRQGVVAAMNIVGKPQTMPSVSGTSGLTLFDYKFASTGVKDIDAGNLEVEVASTYYEEAIRPNFIGDAGKIMMKIHYEKDSHRILGAQLMSREDLTASINTISVAISAKWTLEDLATADFFFQPGFNRPWNYLNVLAQQALNQTYGSDKELF